MEIFGHKGPSEQDIYKKSLEFTEKDIDGSAPAVMKIQETITSLLEVDQTSEVKEAVTEIQKQLDAIYDSLRLNLSTDEDGVLRIKNRSGVVVAESDKDKKSDA